MKQKRNNYAFVDSQNLNLAIRDQGWILDLKRFRVYLKDKYGISKAFLFLGYVEKNKKMYDFFQRVGYTCIFKPTLERKDGHTKGNCDAELVLHTMIEFNNFDKALIVSGDGDFYCLTEYLIKKKKLTRVLIPNENSYSSLLRKLSLPGNKALDFMNTLRNKLEYKRNEKGSRGTKPFGNPFRHDT